MPSVNTLEYTIDYSRQQNVLLKLDRPLACPDHHIAHFDVDDYVEVTYPEEQPEPGIGEDPRYLAEIPRGSTFFASRFRVLRSLAHARKTLLRVYPQAHPRVSLIEEKIYQVLLQMVLYHVKLLSPRGGYEVQIDSPTRRHRHIEDLSKDSGFSSEDFEKNRQFIEEYKAKFEGLFEGAARYWVPEGGIAHQGRSEREELVKAMREMKMDLIEVFDVNPVSLLSHSSAFSSDAQPRCIFGK